MAFDAGAVKEVAQQLVADPRDLQLAEKSVRRWGLNPDRETCVALLALRQFKQRPRLEDLKSVVNVSTEKVASDYILRRFTLVPRSAKPQLDAEVPAEWFAELDSWPEGCSAMTHWALHHGYDHMKLGPDTMEYHYKVGNKATVAMDVGSKVPAICNSTPAPPQPSAASAGAAIAAPAGAVEATPVPPQQAPSEPPEAAAETPSKRSVIRRPSEEAAPEITLNGCALAIEDAASNGRWDGANKAANNTVAFWLDHVLSRVKERRDQYPQEVLLPEHFVLFNKFLFRCVRSARCFAHVKRIVGYYESVEAVYEGSWTPEGRCLQVLSATPLSGNDAPTLHQVKGLTDGQHFKFVKSELYKDFMAARSECHFREVKASNKADSERLSSVEALLAEEEFGKGPAKEELMAAKVLLSDISEAAKVLYVLGCPKAFLWFEEWAPENRYSALKHFVSTTAKFSEILVETALAGAHMVIRSGDEAVGKCVGVSKCVLRDLAALASEADKLAGADAKAYVDDVFREIILSRLGCKGAESYGSERWGQVAEANPDIVRFITKHTAGPLVLKRFEGKVGSAIGAAARVARAWKDQLQQQQQKQKQEAEAKHQARSPDDVGPAAGDAGTLNMKRKKDLHHAQVKILRVNASGYKVKVMSGALSGEEKQVARHNFKPDAAQTAQGKASGASNVAHDAKGAGGAEKAQAAEEAHPQALGAPGAAQKAKDEEDTAKMKAIFGDKSDTE